MLLMNKLDGTPLYIQLYQELKSQILQQIWVEGSKLPASRQLAQELKISRNTVELAYERLYLEDLIESRPRSGFYVKPQIIVSSKSEETESTHLRQPEENIRYHFDFQHRNAEDFPIARWKRLIHTCLQDYQQEFFQNVCPFGEIGLRTEIQRYLWRQRGVRCRPQQVIIGTGTSACIQSFYHLLPAQSQLVAEQSGGELYFHSFPHSSWLAPVVSVPSSEITPKNLELHKADVVYITPSSQYSAAFGMPLHQRLALAEWAKKNNTLILEDDYNCAFHYEGKSLPTLHSMCPDHTVYFGTFSDTMFPTICVSYMVLPEPFRKTVCEAHCGEECQVPFLTQKTLELFMEDGGWRRHLNHMLQLQLEKRNLLIESLKEQMGKHIRIQAGKNGLHLLVTARWNTTEQELLLQAEQQGVKIYPAAASSNTSIPPKKTVLLHFGGISKSDIPDAVNRLCKAWNLDEK